MTGKGPKPEETGRSKDAESDKQERTASGMRPSGEPSKEPSRASSKEPSTGTSKSQHAYALERHVEREDEQMNLIEETDWKSTVALTTSGSHVASVGANQSSDSEASAPSLSRPRPRPRPITKSTPPAPSSAQLPLATSISTNAVQPQVNEINGAEKGVEEEVDARVPQASTLGGTLPQLLGACAPLSNLVGVLILLLTIRPSGCVEYPVADFGGRSQCPIHFATHSSYHRAAHPSRRRTTFPSAFSRHDHPTHFATYLSYHRTAHPFRRPTSHPPSSRCSRDRSAPSSARSFASRPSFTIESNYSSLDGTTRPCAIHCSRR